MGRRGCCGLRMQTLVSTGCCAVSRTTLSFDWRRLDCFPSHFLVPARTAPMGHTDETVGATSMLEARAVMPDGSRLRSETISSWGIAAKRVASNPKERASCRGDERGRRRWRSADEGVDARAGVADRPPSAESGEGFRGGGRRETGGGRWEAAPARCARECSGKPLAGGQMVECAEPAAAQ